MAFCTRSHREGGAVGSSNTPANLGPGSYSVNSSGSKKISYAPFASSSERGGVDDMIFSPGPGEYTHKSSSSSHKTRASSASFISRVDRSALSRRPASAQVPGPGSYRTSNSWIKKRSKPRKQKQASQAVQWVKVTSAPSIPTTKESYGYEKNREGDLVLQPPPTQGFTGRGISSAGPGDYEPHKPFGLEARGTNFHRSRVHRNNGTRSKGKSKARKATSSGSSLGPGQYNADAYSNLSSAVEKQSNKSSSAFVSKIDRLPKQAAPLVPGPGHYDLGSAFNRALEQGEPDYQFFGSKTERTQTSKLSKNSTPGPGSYGGAVVKEYLQDNDRPATAGFQSTSGRFTRPKTASELGPGQYDTQPNISYELSKKVFGRNSSFGATEQRFNQPKLQTEVPPVGTYQERKLVRPVKQNSVFQSSSVRMSRSEKKNGPSPGSYDAPTTFDNRDPELARSSAAFKSTSRKVRSVGKAKPRVDASKVGPGSYEAKDKLRNQTDIYKGNDASFRSSNPRMGGQKKEHKIPSYNSSTIEVPGPGSYDGENVNAGLVKGSFNITVSTGDPY